MARAFLSLYSITADPAWLTAAGRTADFIASHFVYKLAGEGMGYATAGNDPGFVFALPKPDFDENVSLARFANLLFHETARIPYREMRDAALHFAGSAGIVQAERSSVGGLLLAKQESESDPLHIAIVGQKKDVLAMKLFTAALAWPRIYKQIDWIDDRQTGIDANGVRYPKLTTAAAYVCSGESCSEPVLDTNALEQLLKRKVSMLMGNP